MADWSSPHGVADLAGLADPAGAHRAPPALVLHHGLHDSAHCWPDALRRWSPNWQVIPVEARGHGQAARFTPDQLTGLPGEVLVDDAVALLEAVRAASGQAPIGIGHSLGAAVLAAAAARRPELVSGLVLEDPAWGVEEQATVEQLRQRAADRLAWSADFATDFAAALAAGRRDHPDWPAEEFLPWAQAKAGADPAFLALTSYPTKDNWRQVAAGLRAPTVVLAGDQGEDVIMGAYRRAELARIGNPWVQVRLIPGAGHCVRRDRAERYHGVVDPWLERRRQSAVAS